MSYNWNGQSFPRKISEIESYWLDFILPESNKIYQNYKEKIKDLYVIGYAKNSPFSLILGKKEDNMIDDYPSLQIVATGFFEYDFGKVEISLYEFFEGHLQLDIFVQSQVDINQFNINDLKKRELHKAAFLNWKPGNNHPYDNSSIREVEIQEDKVTLAISEKHKRIWVYEHKNEMIHFIPITNFYQEVLKVARIKSPETITNINYFFLNLNKFTDELIQRAFINYNKIWKKIDYPVEVQISVKKENLLKKILKRLKWKI